MTAVYARRASATRWCAGFISPHAITTRCRDAWAPDAASHEIAGEVPPLALLEAKPASPKAKKPRIAENVTPWYEEKPTLECGKCHHMYLTKGGLRQHKANSKVRSCATWKR